MTAVLDPEWRTKAACQGHDPALWYPERSGPPSQRAARICGECPVKFECGDDAERRDEPWGIWGGKQRRAVTLGSPQRKPGRTRDERVGPDMVTSRCMHARCGRYWTHNAGPRDNFSVISKFCPDCVAKFPAQGWGMVR